MWLRYVQVIVTNRDDPSKKVVFQDHKIDFEIRSTIGWAADTATITLTNLSVEEMKFLQSKEFGQNTIEIRAGYRDQYDLGGVDKTTPIGSVQVRPDYSGEQTGKVQESNTLFSGSITNAVGFKQPPEHIFTMFCLSTAAVSSSSFTQMRDIPNGATLMQAIISMSEDYGYGTISQYGVTSKDLEVVLPLGRTFHDTFLNEFSLLLGEYNLSYRITTGEIQIFPDTYADKDAVDRMAKDRDPVRLDVNSVIGTPIAGIKTFRLNTFINSGIQPGMVLDVSPLMGEDLLINGVVNVQNNSQGTLNYSQSVFRYAMTDLYLIQEVVHHGSTHGMIFQTSLACIIGGATAMGGSELSWQNAYAASGMAMDG